MRKILAFFFIVMFGMLCLINYALPADAARKSKKPKVDEAAIEQMTEKVDLLTRKYYMRELYTPADADNLINLKLQLDTLMDTSPEPAFAPIYYKLGTLYKLRGMKKESIDSLKTIIENFSDTAYSPKAIELLKEMGVVINEEVESEEDEEDY